MGRRIVGWLVGRLNWSLVRRLVPNFVGREIVGMSRGAV